MNALAMPLRRPCVPTSPSPRAQGDADGGSGASTNPALADASLLAAGSVGTDAEVAELARMGRRTLLLTGAAVADVFVLASVLVELGTQAVRDGGRVRLEVWHRGDALEILAFEPASRRGPQLAGQGGAGRPRIGYGQSVAALARVVRSVELRQGGTAGLRVRVELPLDDAQQV